MILINKPDGSSWMYERIKGVKKYMASKMTDADAKECFAASGVEVVDDHLMRANLDRA